MSESSRYEESRRGRTYIAFHDVLFAFYFDPTVPLAEASADVGRDNFEALARAYRDAVLRAIPEELVPFEPEPEPYYGDKAGGPLPDQTQFLQLLDVATNAIGRVVDRTRAYRFLRKVDTTPRSNGHRSNQADVTKEKALAIGPWILLEPLGRGGNATVLRARHMVPPSSWPSRLSRRGNEPQSRTDGLSGRFVSCVTRANSRGFSHC